MAGRRTVFICTFIIICTASALFAGQSWQGVQVMPSSANVQVQSDDGSLISMYDIAWPAAVQKTRGRYLWIQDEGGYSGNRAGGWIYSDDVVKLDDARDYYADKLRDGETAWLDWMCGVSWEAKGEPTVAILNYQNALAIQPNTRIDDVELRLGRLLAQQQLRNGRGKYNPAQRAVWESHFQNAQRINPDRPQLYYEWGLALTHACSCTQAKPAAARGADKISASKSDVDSSSTGGTVSGGPTSAGADAAVQSLAKYERAESLSPRWWRIPLARAELMLNQCDQESPDSPGERAAVPDGKPEFFTSLVKNCKNKHSRSNMSSLAGSVNSDSDEPLTPTDSNEKNVRSAISLEMANVLAVAMDDFNRSISLNVNALDAYRDRAEVLRLLNRLDEAQQSATIACKLCYYRQAGSLRTLAQINHDLQLFQPAADYALRAAELVAGDDQQRYLQLWYKCSRLSSGDTAMIAVASAKAGYVASRGEESTEEDSAKVKLPSRIEPPAGFLSRASNAVPD